jgi:hypothetical protein
MISTKHRFSIASSAKIGRKSTKNSSQRPFLATKSHRHRNAVDAVVKVTFAVEIREIQVVIKSGCFNPDKPQLIGFEYHVTTR